MRKVVLFGGSFNPIHLGHIALVRTVASLPDVDEVWLMVSPQNPLKETSELLSSSLRLRLAREATQDMDKVKVSDFEFSLPQPSFTYHTLQALQEKNPQTQFSLLIGADNWVNLPRWAKWKELLQKYHFYVYPRIGYSLDTLPTEATRIDAPLFKISSTTIRKAIEKGEDISEWVPRCVAEWAKSIETKTITY